MAPRPRKTLMPSGRRDNSYHLRMPVFNDSRTQRLADRITVPSEFKKALDVDRDEPIVLDGSALSLEVDAEDVRVFHLSP